MKTRDKILLVSLDLFNSEGAPNVTTIDIANELNISPGNLYYHFKGKDSIIEELYQQFETEFISILTAPENANLNTQDSWFYLYVVFEHIYKFRFFYQSLSDILQSHPTLNKRFKRLLDRKYQTTKSIIELLISKQIVVVPAAEVTKVCENIVLVMTYWLNYTHLRRTPMDESQQIHDGVFQIVSVVAPLLEAQYQYLYGECQQLYRDICEQS